MIVVCLVSDGSKVQGGGRAMETASGRVRGSECSSTGRTDFSAPGSSTDVLDWSRCQSSDFTLGSNLCTPHHTSELAWIQRSRWLMEWPLIDRTVLDHWFRVPTHPGKSLIFFLDFPGPSKSSKVGLIMDKSWIFKLKVLGSIGKWRSWIVGEITGDGFKINNT